MTPSPTTPTTSMHRYAATVGSVVVAALAVAGIALAARWGQVPDVVASHWGPGGVDATQAKGTAALTATVIVVVMALVFAVLARTLHPDGRRYLAAATGFATGLTTVIAAGSMLAQIGLDDPYAATNPAWVVLAILVSLVAGVALWLLNPPPAAPPRQVSKPLPAGAPVLEVSPGERVAWVGHTAPMHGGGMLALALVLLVAAVVTWMASPWAALIPVLIGALLVMTLHARLTIDTSGVRLSSGPVTWIRLPLGEIQSANATEVRPLREFGGFGLRFSGERRGYVTRRGEALELRQADGSATVISLDDADGAAAVVNTLLRSTSRL